MGKHKTKTTGKGRLDKFYYLAKEQGFRSRAAFKLVQLDRKFRFLEKAHSVLDLCAAPGGWMQVAGKNMPVGSLIIGVDLVPIRPIRGAFTLQEDITTGKCKSAIKKLMKEQGHNVIEVVLHDGSPNVGGAWSSEATSQAALVLDSLKLAVEFLAAGGTFVTKVFRSQDYTALLYAFKQLFEKVEVTKPVASRTTSAEIYVVGLKYRAPGQIDPRLLDSRHLFQQVEEAPKVVDVLRPSKQKRHREGYEDGKTTLFRECTASDFVWAEKPVDLLGRVTSITFLDESSVPIRDHTLTDKEIKTLCEDLRVLGKQEFKQLLKWRIKVRSDLKPSVEEQDVEEKEISKGAPKASEEDTILAEMEELKQVMDAKKRKAKKVASKRKAKTKARTATGMQVDVMMDKYGDEDLFSLAAMKAKKDLARIEDAASSDENEEVYSSDDDIPSNSKNADENNSDFDSDEERQRYDAALEEYLDEAYDTYCKNTDGSTARRKRAKLENSDLNGELWEEGEEIPLTIQSRGSAKAPTDEKNPLLVDLSDEVKLSKEQVVENWFSQDIFADYKAQTEEKQIEELAARNEKKLRRISGDELIQPSDNTNDKSRSKANDDGDAGDFEVVAAEQSGSDDQSTTDDDESDYNDNAKAETLAYAKKMLRKKNRESILDDAYNRYTFDDEALPRWFAEDEKKHSQAIKPVTKEDVEAMQAQFKAINARPVRKVAEAKARKKRRAAKKLEKARVKATAIADQEDISSSAKRKQMERLYAKANAAPTKERRKIVVAKKGVGAKGGAGRVVVDRRMKSDQRQRGAGKTGRGGKPAGKKAKGNNKAKGPAKKGVKVSKNRRT